MKPKLAPREVPIGVGFYAPQSELIDATLAFLEELFAAEKRLEDDSAQQSELLAALGRPAADVARLSMAVQVFVVFTIEAALSSYGTMRFGEHGFNSQLRKLPLPKRIDALFADKGTGPQLDALKEIIVGLSAKRDSVVHPKSGEYLHSPDGTVTKRPSIEPADVSAAAARESFRTMQSAFRLIQTIDPGAAGSMAVPWKAYRTYDELTPRPDVNFEAQQK